MEIGKLKLHDQIKTIDQLYFFYFHDTGVMAASEIPPQMANF